MNRLDQTCADLLYLVSCALNEEKPDRERCAAMDLDAVYALSQMHMLTAAAAHALGEVTELPRPFDQVMKKNIRKLALFDVERAQIFAALEQARIRYLPLKGILLKAYYPKSAMREMSDNDILCDSDRMEDVRSLMEGMGYTCESFGAFNHDVYSKPPSLEFEMHHALFSKDESERFTAYYAGIFDRLTPAEGTSYGYRMSDEDFYLYVLCHIYKHYHNAGTGLRSLTDIYVFCRRRYDTLDKAYLAGELEKLGLTAFEEDIRTLSAAVFTGQTLTDEQLRELAYYVHSGKYGTIQQHEYLHLRQNLGNDDSGRSKRRYLRGRVFISGESLKRKYPFVYRHKYLYPALLIYRPFRGLFTHPAGIVRECRKVFRFKKNKDFGSHNR